MLKAGTRLVIQVKELDPTKLMIRSKMVVLTLDGHVIVNLVLVGEFQGISPVVEYDH